MRRGALVFACVMLGAARALASGYSELNLGVIYHEREDWDAAIQHFTAALNAPDLPAAYRSVAYSDRGDAYLEKHNPEKAIADYTAALAADPDYLQALVNRGISYASEKKYDSAVADFSALIARRPMRDLTYAARGRVYEAQEKYDAAIADFSTVIKLTPSAAGGYIMRGFANRMLNQYDASIDDYSKAIDINGNLPGAYLGRALAYRDQGSYADAVRDMQTALKDKPNPDELRDLGITQWDAGRFADAAQTLQQAAQAKNADAYTYLWRQIAAASVDAHADSGLRSAVAALDLKQWPGPVLRVYLGDAPPDSATKAAASADAPTQTNQTCEANFYIATWHMLAGEKATAMPMLQAAQAQCPHEFIERDAAAAELKRLQ